MLVPLVIISCLYFFEAIKYYKTYKEHALNQIIDISESNLEYNFEYGHTFYSESYLLLFKLIIPPSLLSPGKTWIDVTQNVSFRLKVILRNGSNELLNEIFTVDNGSYIAFSKRYSYQREDSRLFNLYIKVLEAERNGNFSKVSVTARGMSKGSSLTRDFYFILLIIFGLLFISLILKMIVDSAATRNNN
jgi:hypothetical protein